MTDQSLYKWLKHPMTKRAEVIRAMNPGFTDNGVGSISNQIRTEDLSESTKRKLKQVFSDYLSGLIKLNNE